jgi:ATP-binding cassette, subfamily C (CFTR/MRP), member 1
VYLIAPDETVLLCTVRYYAWEALYAHRVGTHRSQELAALRRSALAASVSAAILAFIPVLAAVLTFVTYAYTGHALEVSTVFSSLQLFATIRAPLNMMMYVLRAMLGGHVALKRMNAYFNAEDAEGSYIVDSAMSSAVSVDASFTWESANGTEDEASDDAKTKNANPLPTVALPFSASESTEEVGEDADPLPFMLKNVKLDIPRGAFVAIGTLVWSSRSIAWFDFIDA